MRTPSAAAGFTLIELIISIALGLLLTAAATQIVISSSQSVALQQGSGDVQDAALFGVDRLIKNIRMANFSGGAPSPITATTPLSGVVVATANMPTGGSAAWITQSGALASDNLGKGSDQLTIQYYAQPVANSANVPTDCEGNPINNVVTAAQANTNGFVPPQILVTERYFLREDASAAGQIPTTYALACDAGQSVITPAVTPSPLIAIPLTNLPVLGANSQIIIPRVDHFAVMLGIRNGGAASTIQFVSPTNYIANYGSVPIVAVKVGLLLRSNQPIPGVIQQTTFDDITSAAATPTQLTLPVLTGAAANVRYFRQNYVRTIAINNSGAQQQ